MPLAYHFLKDDMTAGSGTEKPWTVGETRRISGKLTLCVRGYHSCPSPSGALKYAQGSVLCLVDVSKPRASDKTKAVSSRRTLVKAVNVERELHEVACRIAEDVLPIFEKQFPLDKRPRLAIEAKRKWLRGELDDEGLAAAETAALGVAAVSSVRSGVSRPPGESCVGVRRQKQWPHSRCR